MRRGACLRVVVRMPSTVVELTYARSSSRCASSRFLPYAVRTAVTAMLADSEYAQSSVKHKFGCAGRLFVRADAAAVQQELGFIVFNARSPGIRFVILVSVGALTNSIRYAVAAVAGEDLRFPPAQGAPRPIQLAILAASATSCKLTTLVRTEPSSPAVWTRLSWSPSVIRPSGCGGGDCRVGDLWGGC